MVRGGAFSASGVLPLRVEIGGLEQCEWGWVSPRLLRSRFCWSPCAVRRLRRKHRRAHQPSSRASRLAHCLPRRAPLRPVTWRNLRRLRDGFPRDRTTRPRPALVRWQRSERRKTKRRSGSKWNSKPGLTVRQRRKWPRTMRGAAECAAIHGPRTACPRASAASLRAMSDHSPSWRKASASRCTRRRGAVCARGRALSCKDRRSLSPTATSKQTRWPPRKHAGSTPEAVFPRSTSPGRRSLDSARVRSQPPS